MKMGLPFGASNAPAKIGRRTAKRSIPATFVVPGGNVYELILPTHDAPIISSSGVQWKLLSEL
jgi:hypothetical protein